MKLKTKTAHHKTASKATRKVTLPGGIQVELLLGPGREFLGLGRVTVGGVTLRSAGVPLRPYIKSLRGVVYPRFLLDGIRQKRDGSVEIQTTAIGEPLLEGEYGDEYNGVLLWPAEKAKRVEDSLVWILRPETLQVRDTTYTGLSYAWRFRSRTERIARIVAKTTWELGGQARGNTLLSQGQVTPPVYTAEKDTHFTSACLKQLKRFDDPLGVSFQLGPRYSPHQQFDFQAGRLGSLIGYWPDRADVKSFVQKNRGENVFFTIDVTSFSAANAVETQRKCIGFAPSGAEGMPEHEMRNRWKDAFDVCGDMTRGLYGIKRSRPLPESLIGYSLRLENDGRVMIRVKDAWVPSQEWLVAMADTYFPELASRGIRRIIPEPVCQTDPTERGHVCKLNSGIHGDLNVGSVCCIHRYVPAEFWGGMKAWQYYYRKAHEHGLEVGHWIGPHVSHQSLVLLEHPDWAVRTFATLVAAGGYPNFELACMNFNTGFRQWMLDDLKRWHDEGGLDYVWFDSLGNLGCYPTDFSHDLQPNQIAIAEFIADLQKIGIANIELEGTGPFGVCSAGVYDPNQGDIKTMQGVVGQNTWDWYAGNEDMFCDQAPRVEIHRDRPEDQVRQSFFRCLANRCIPMFGRYARGFAERPEWFKAYLDTYFAVENDLVRRRLLPGRQGVVWTGGSSEILFAYAPARHAVPAGAKVEQIRAGRAETVACDGTLAAEAWTVYRVGRN